MECSKFERNPWLPDAGEHPAGPSNPSDLQTDPELAGLVPPPTEDERARLEASLLEKGCRSPLAIWKGCHVLLDGHERLALCRRYGLPFRTTEIPLPDRDAARRWVVANQLARRNPAGVGEAPGAGSAFRDLLQGRSGPLVGHFLTPYRAPTAQARNGQPCGPARERGACRIYTPVRSPAAVVPPRALPGGE
jgi:hypothetical protein